jgi:signal transduction histidine kinase
MNLHLTPEERLGLRALALSFGMKPAELLRRFVSDLTGSLRSGGSDEELCASAWVSRALIVEARRPASARRQRRVERLQFLAHEARTSERAAQMASRKSTTQDTQ